MRSLCSKETCSVTAGSNVSHARDTYTKAATQKRATVCVAAHAVEVAAGQETDQRANAKETKQVKDATNVTA